MTGHHDRSVLGGGVVLERPLIVPPGSFVEGTGSCIACNDCEPALGVSICPDLSFGLTHKRTSDGGPSMGRRDVDLLDLIVNDDDEACDRSVDDGDRRLADPFRRSGSERFLRSGVDQLLRNEPEVSISPAEIPDLSDGAGVLLVPLAKHHVSVVGHRQPNLATRGAATRRQFLSLGLPPAHAGARDTLWRRMSEAEQLGALARLHELFERNRIEYWLFGGWAVDFHAGSVTRPHDDLDLAVWLQDHDRIAALLAADGWDHAPEEDEDGFTGYVRRAVHLELAFLARDENGHVYTPLREGRAAWPGEAFESDLRELRGVRARIISLQALRADKSEAHDDPRVAAKDRADSAVLSHLH